MQYIGCFVWFSADKDCVLPMIHFLQQHGNATVYQYRSGTIPDKVMTLCWQFGCNVILLYWHVLNKVIVDVAEEVADDTSAAVVGELHVSVESAIVCLINRWHDMSTVVC